MSRSQVPSPLNMRNSQEAVDMFKSITFTTTTGSGRRRAIPYAFSDPKEEMTKRWFKIVKMNVPPIDLIDVSA